MPEENKQQSNTEEIIRDVEQERIRAAAAGGAPQDIVFTLPDNTVVKGKSWEEIAQKTAKMKSDTATALHDREEQIRTLKATPLETREVVRDSNPNTFDKNKYQEMWLNDPTQAQDYLDSFRPSYQEITQEVGINKQIREIAIFHDRVPDFGGGDEAAGILMRRLQNERKGITADNLEAAYYASLRAGELKPVEKAEENEEKPAPSRRPPPSLRSNSQHEERITDVNEWAEKAPMDDLRATIERLERQKA